MEKDYISVCSVCGFPLTSDDVHGVISGHMHVSIGDGKENRFAVAMHMCKECTRKIASFTVMDVEEAKVRAAELENYG